MITVQDKILYYLNNKSWTSGMEIESKAYEWRSKRIGRTLREMSSGENPLLEKSYTNDKHHAVQYRIYQPSMSASTANAYLKKIGLEEERNRQVSFI